MRLWNATHINRFCSLFLLLIPALAAGQGQPFPCDGRFFVVASKESDGPSAILSAFPDQIGQALIWDTVLVTSDHFIGPIGFSVLDNHLYALDTASWDILKINAAGEVEIRGNIASKVDTSLEYRAGCVTPPGIKFSLVGRNKSTQSDERMYNVRLDQEPIGVGSLGLVTQSQLQMEDIAYDPQFGVLYGFDAVNRRLVQIGGGLATGYNFLSAAPEVSIAGLFFDRDGNLYGYGRGAGGNGKDNTLFAISKSTGALTPLKSIAQSVRSDACSCPYSISLTRTFTPAVALPCDTVRLVYRITNFSGFIYRTISLRDLLPAGLEITKVVHKPFPASMQPTADDSLRFDFSDLPLGTDSIVLEVVIDQSGQIAGSFQPAVLDSFPMGLNYEVLSVESSASRLNVVSLSVDIAGDTVACFGKTIGLSANAAGAAGGVSYLWSDGSTGPLITVTTSGTYAVEVSNGCLSDMDSVQVRFPDAPLSVHLEEEIIVEEGTGWLISALVNGTPPYTFAWDAPYSAGLSCATCASPVAQPSEDVTLTVTVTDAWGCEAQDSIRLLVNKIRDIRAANVFTPNGDGIQDQFFLIGEAAAIVRQFSVLDRWGRILHQAADMPLNEANSGWNGLDGARPAPEGVYFWTALVQYADGSEEQFRGQITLIR